MNWITLGLLACLLAVFFQDWKFRKINVLLPLLIFAVSFYLVQAEKMALLKIVALNIAFFSLTFGLLVAYMSIRNRRFQNPFEIYFGFGDFLFYVAITPLFSLQNYIFFFIASMVFALLLQLSFRKLMKQSTVPLAGFAAVLLAIVVFIEATTHFRKITLL